MAPPLAPANARFTDRVEPRVPVLGWPGKLDRLPFENPSEGFIAFLGAVMADPSISLTWGLPSLGFSRWHLGGCSRIGPVRDENQDFYLAFQFGPISAVIVADGAGGVPLGAEASRAACLAAALGLVRQVAHVQGSTRELGALASIALERGEATLRSIGGRRGIVTLGGGLRTTLIALVADGRHLACAHIGDGSAILMRRSGEVLPLTAEARDEDGNLQASIGPVPHGEATCVVLDRLPGDLAAVMTDGASDIASKSFPQALMSCVVAREGDLDSAAAEVVEALAASRLCSDNVTLALLGTGEPTPDSAGFQNRSADRLDRAEGPGESESSRPEDPLKASIPANGIFADPT